MSDRRAGIGSKRYGARCGDHLVEMEFDTRRIVVNKATLYLDGEAVDEAHVFYGDKELRTTAADGTEIVVVIDSGMVGELTRAQLRQADGSWVDLQERAASH